MEKLKVLIADDDRMFHQLYAVALKGDRWDKKLVDNGEDALSLYNSWEPDIVILDIMMPVMSGYTALKGIREREKESGKHTTVIMATNMSDKSDIMDCVKLGIQGYIVKPFKHKELAAKIEGYHEGKQVKKGG